MNRRPLLIALSLVLAGVRPGELAAQGPLTLAEAMTRADRHAWANRLSAAEADARAAAADQANRGILPGFRTEASWTRTTDPLNAFGFLLRQRAVTPDAFDPARLNAPAPISHLATGLVLEVPLLNLDAWAGRSAGALAARAARSAQDWTAEQVRMQVVHAWFGGVLARDRVTTLEAAHAAGQSHVRRAERLLEQGLVTRSDLLLAQVKAGEIETQLLEARGQAGLALQALAMALGTPGDSNLTLPGALPTDSAVQAFPIAAPAGVRADVASAAEGAEAAERNVRRTTLSLLPRVNAFGRYDWNAPDALVAGRAAWTVGIMASWAPYSGGVELALRREAAARARQATAMAEATRARADLEQAERRSALGVALAALPIAERAVRQSAEAHRIVARKYEGGLATVTDLLEASAVETSARLARAHAIYRAILAHAEWRVAVGADVAALAALETVNP